MSKIALSPNSSGTGTFTIASPNSNTSRTLTLPDQDGTIALGSGFTTKDIVGISSLADDVDFSTTSSTDVNLSTNTSYTPVSNQSNFIVYSSTDFTMTVVDSSGGGHTRASFNLTYYDGTNYQTINEATNPLIGTVGYERRSTTSYHYAQFNAIAYLTQSALRSDNGTLHLTVRGHRDYANMTLTTSATNILIIEVV